MTTVQKTAAAVLAAAVLGTSCVWTQTPVEMPAGVSTYYPSPREAGIVLPSALYGPRALPCLRLKAERSQERDFHALPEVVATRRLHRMGGFAFEVHVTPRMLVVGQRDVEISIQLRRSGRDFRFSPRTPNTFALEAEGPGGEAIRLQRLQVRDGALAGTVPEVREGMIGWHTLVLTIDGALAEPIPLAVRVVRSVRLALTFDDGPSVERFGYLGRTSEGEPRTSTEKILDVLAEEGIAAAFFVLTSPDTFLWRTHAKAETPEGFALLRRTVREGHVLAAHWGGEYGHQTICHPARLALPAYDYDGDGATDRITPDGSALESDLLQCVERIRQAYAAEGCADRRPEFIRPPLWKFRAGGRDARQTYEALGLKMIFTDAKLFDGGYPWAGFTLESALAGGIDSALRSGHCDIVLTMHDSNPHTARDIEKVIASIRRCMRSKGLAEKTQWRFVDDSEELCDLLRHKDEHVGLASAE